MPQVENPEPIEINPINWGTYRIAMLSDPAYQRVSAATTDKLSLARLETFFAIEAEQWPIALNFWGLMLGGCPAESLPTANETQLWSAIALATNMPFHFNEAGELIINDD